MRSRAWAFGFAVVLCAAGVWADDDNDDHNERRVVIIGSGEIESLGGDSDEMSREIADAIREALREAREEMGRAGVEVRRSRDEAMRIRIEDRDELREALREAFRESQGALHEAGVVMREFMAQGLPGLTGIAPLAGAGPFFGDSGAGAARSVDERKPAAGVREIQIENVSGRIVIEGWDQDEIHVQGSIGEDVEELVFLVEGDSAEVHVKVPKGRRNPKIRSELTIHVPRRLRVEAQTVSGGLEARNIDGDYIDLETVSGGVSVSGCSGDIEASTTSGGIDIADARGEIRAECVSGGIDVTGEPSKVSAESVSGSIEIHGVQREVETNSVSGRTSIYAGALDRLDVESVSGGFDYEGAIAPNGRFDVSSISGGVRLTFTSEVSAEFDIESFSGGINIDLPGAPTSAKRQVSFRTGTGAGRIDVESFSGGVRIDHK